MSAMILTELTHAQKEQICTLHTSFPLDGADLFAVLEADGAIRSAAAFLKEDETTYECFAYTEPAYRSQGMFSELLDLAIDELPEDTEFLFYTNGSDPDCMAVLEALEAELVMEEYMMEISLSEIPAADKVNDISVKEIDVEGTRTLQYKSSFGIVNISVFSSYYYLYGFEITEELRGQGYGTRFLLQVLSDLAKRNPMPLRLQVSGDNLPALSLYKKTGFQITETLFGYLY